MHTKDSTNHLGNSKEETIQARRRPNRSPALGFPPLVEAGKNEQRHDDASKKVTAPTGIAIIRLTQGHKTRCKESPLGSLTERGEPKMMPRSRPRSTDPPRRGWTEGIQPLPSPGRTPAPPRRPASDQAPRAACCREQARPGPSK
jgi:hypothetical protein